MKQLRVLCLDGDSGHALQQAADRVGIKLIITSETEGDIYDRHGYTVSERSLQLAREATPDQYHAVIIGNNLGTGRRKAAKLPESLRPATLIVWNDAEDSMEAPYVELGFSHFALRHRLRGRPPRLTTVEAFLADMAQLSSTTR